MLHGEIIVTMYTHSHSFQWMVRLVMATDTHA